MTNESSKLFKTRAVKSRHAYGNGVQIDYAPVAELGLQSKLNKNPSPAQSSHEGGASTLAKRPRKRGTVTFGSVTIKGSNQPLKETQRNIASGNSALGRAASAFLKPGVKLSRGKDIPLYRADPSEPRILIRELNGRSERGALVDGEFKLAE